MESAGDWLARHDVKTQISGQVKGKANRGGMTPARKFIWPLGRLSESLLRQRPHSRQSLTLDSHVFVKEKV